MQLVYGKAPIFLWDLNYKLGAVRRDLDELEAAKLLAGPKEALRTTGYHYNFGLGPDEKLLTLASVPASHVLKRTPERTALVFQHCFAESAVLFCDAKETDIGSRNRYFPAELMRELQLDNLPYFCSFASGCAGFVAVLIAAGGLVSTPGDQPPVICIMADNVPSGVSYNMQQERILVSDHSSAFVVGGVQQGYQLLGVNFLSMARMAVPFVEIVKRTVQMVQDLAAGLNLDLKRSDVAVHYPNIFPETWRMVTRYLNLPTGEHVLDGMAERAHCMASDSIISLAKMHRGQEGRIHVVVNYGIGLHLGVCILREMAVTANV